MSKKTKFKRVLSTVAIFLLVFALSGCTPTSTTSLSGDSPTPTVAQTSNPTNGAKPVVETVKKYSDGVYLVGDDIKPGLYKVSVTDQLLGMGYVERSKSVDMSFESILANIILTGDGYVEIVKTDKAVKLTGVEIYKIDLKKYKKNIKKEVSDGIYLVGYDISPGTYKVSITDTTSGMAYVERTKKVSMNAKDIIANNIFQGPGYVQVKKTDFAIRVQGAKLTLKK